MASPFVIREYRPSDHENILLLHTIALKKIGVDFGPGPWNDDLKNIEKVYFENKGTFVVGELDGKIIAMGAFKKYDEETAEIKRMRVHPDFQRKGYGTLLLKELEKRAKIMGYTKLRLDTSNKQKGAYYLYIKNGFKLLKKTKTVTPQEKQIGIKEILFFEKKI